MAAATREEILSDPNAAATREEILSDPNNIRLLMQYNLLRAQQARESPRAFFEYVMREETSQACITLAAHQRVMMDFVWRHPRCVVMMPPEHSKTFCTAAIALHIVGEDPTMRGMIISGTQAQAEKPLKLIKDYIESSPAMRLVYPRLQRSQRASAPWTQTQIEIDRPLAIRDATFVAVGQGSNVIDGSRLDFIMVDDLLNEENTATKEQRDKVFSWFQKTVATRLVKGRRSRLIVTNTARHPEDVAHRLRDKLGWPTLRMSVSGNVYLEGNPKLWAPGWGLTDHIAKELRPAQETSKYNPASRLTAHDPDPQNLQTLWPDKMNRAVVEDIKHHQMLPLEFAQLYEQDCRDDATSPCKLEYINACKQRAIELDVVRFLDSWASTGEDSAVTGVDLSTGESGDYSAIFTFYVRPSDKVRVVLDIRYGMWGAPEIIDQIIDVHRRFNSVVRVEDNGTQKHIRQMVTARAPGAHIVGHNTDATKKKDPNFGLMRMFVEFRNGMWAFPTNRHGQCPEPMQKFIDDALFYRPSAHTPDTLMAAHLAMAQAHEWGMLTKFDQNDQAQVQSIGAGIMAR
jgi:hypothetical protein